MSTVLKKCLQQSITFLRNAMKRHKGMKNADSLVNDKTLCFWQYFVSHVEDLAIPLAGKESVFTLADSGIQHSQFLWKLFSKVSTSKCLEVFDFQNMAVYFRFSNFKVTGFSERDNWQVWFLMYVAARSNSFPLYVRFHDLSLLSLSLSRGRRPKEINCCPLSLSLSLSISLYIYGHDHEIMKV